MKSFTNAVESEGSEQHGCMRGFTLGWLRKAIDSPVVSSGLFTHNKSMLCSAVGCSYFLDLIFLGKSCGVTLML